MCDRLWFKNDLKPINVAEQNVLLLKGSYESVEGFKGCNTCRSGLKRGNVPILATTNGFYYPPRPSHLTEMNAVEERLVTPRMPFMQFRRLFQVEGSLSIVGQVINMPVSVDEMVNVLPRCLGDDHAFNVSIKKHLIHKSTYLTGFVRKKVIFEWLEFLCQFTLYKQYGIKFDRALYEQATAESSDPQIELETINSGEEHELLMGQQQTLLWNEDQCLEIAPAQNRRPLSFLYDQHAEELSFPQIYLGKPRTFNPGIKVTQFMMATSEIRRAGQNHILYMALSR